jgi:hypothetical protein
LLRSPACRTMCRWLTLKRGGRRRR